MVQIGCALIFGQELLPTFERIDETASKSEFKVLFILKVLRE